MAALKAHAMVVSFCPCGCGLFEFSMLDSSGEAIAIGQLPSEAALMIADQIVSHVAGDEEDEDEIGPVEGHA